MTYSVTKNIANVVLKVELDDCSGSCKTRNYSNETC